MSADKSSSLKKRSVPKPRKRKFVPLEERKEFYQDGQIMIHGFYRNGKKEGENKRWYENGQLWVHSFHSNGKFQGKLKAWHMNGKLKLEISYENDEINGERKHYHRNGKLWEYDFYRNGKKEGESKTFDNNGNMICYFYYINDAVSSTFSWENKHAFLNLKRRLYYKRSLHALDPHIIPDLAKIICGYISG